MSKQVKCIRSEADLTVGSVYEVIDEKTNEWLVRDDAGDVYWYNKHKFEVPTTIPHGTSFNPTHTGIYTGHDRNYTRGNQYALEQTSNGWKSMNCKGDIIKKSSNWFDDVQLIGSVVPTGDEYAICLDDSGWGQSGGLTKDKKYRITERYTDCSNVDMIKFINDLGNERVCFASRFTAQGVTASNNCRVPSPQYQHSHATNIGASRTSPSVSNETEELQSHRYTPDVW